LGVRRSDTKFPTALRIGEFEEETKASTPPIQAGLGYTGGGAWWLTIKGTLVIQRREIHPLRSSSPAVLDPCSCPRRRAAEIGIKITGSTSIRQTGGLALCTAAAISDVQRSRRDVKQTSWVQKSGGSKADIEICVTMSALPPKAHICQRIEHVCFVPIADIQPFIEAVNQPQELIRVLCARLPFRSELLPGGVLV